MLKKNTFKLNKAKKNRHFKNVVIGAGKMAQQLKALVNLPEGPGSITYTHMMFQPSLTHRRPDTLF